MMRAASRVSLLIPVVVSLTLPAFSQCSDGGICTFNLHAEGEPHRGRNTASLGYLFGTSGAPDDVTYQAIVLNGTVHPFAGARVTATIPMMWQSGPLGRASGPGDLLVAWNQSAVAWEGGGKLELQAGVRLPTGNDNAGPGLPMAYQPGLGSTDILLGSALSAGGVLGGVGYQIAGSRNDNDSVRLERGDLLLVWGGYELRGVAWMLNPQIMAIKQLQESSVRNPAPGGTEFVDAEGSDQLQINLMLRFRYELNSTLAIEALGAIPLLARDVNVDGLKRTLTLSAGIAASY
jgi:hypothetical protein